MKSIGTIIQEMGLHFNRLTRKGDTYTAVGSPRDTENYVDEKGNTRMKTSNNVKITKKDPTEAMNELQKELNKLI